MMNKEKRQKRFQQKKRHINRQTDIYENFVGSLNKLVEDNWGQLAWNRHKGKDKGNSKHRFHKKHALNCGDSTCIMCMNPRKAWGEKTIQERKFECQAVVDVRKDPIGKWEWEDLNDPRMEWDG